MFWVFLVWRKDDNTEKEVDDEREDDGEKEDDREREYKVKV